MAPTTITRRARRLFLALLLIAVIPAATGCELRVLNILLPDFEASGVDGVEVWRLDESTGEPVTAGILDFLGTKTVETMNGPVEVIEYEIVYADGTRTKPILARMEHDEASPGDVQVRLIFKTAAGIFKVSSYNEAGSSPLSEDAVQLL